MTFPYYFIWSLSYLYFFLFSKYIKRWFQKFRPLEAIVSCQLKIIFYLLKYSLTISIFILFRQSFFYRWPGRFTLFTFNHLAPIIFLKSTVLLNFMQDLIILFLQSSNLSLYTCDLILLWIKICFKLLDLEIGVPFICIFKLS